MRDQLLGYLLGALEPADHELVERRLESDPELRRQLSIIERRLSGLECLRETAAPPPDLALRTCSFIAARVAAGEASRPAANLVRTSSGETRRADAPHQPHQVTLPAATEPPVGRGWSMADLLVAACIALGAGVLFLPALANSRYQSRLTQCQNNLRELGVALVGYSENSGGHFPAIPESGPRAFAGIYGSLLLDSEHLRDPRIMSCPSLALARQREAFHLATLKEIDAATGEMLAKLQEEAGGDYAYTVGYMEDGAYQTPRNKGRNHYALLADAPCPKSGKTQSPNHGGCGQNVLFEDGSVRYLVGCTLAQLGDDIFKNRDGEIFCAGKDADDSVLAPSATPPLRRVSVQK